MAFRKIELSREINGPASVVFEAIKNGLLFKSTGIKENTFEHNFEEGGSYSFSWNVGGKCSGVYKKIVENKSVEFSWKSEDCKSATLKETLVVVTLSQSDDKEKTSLTLVHEGLDDGFSYEDHLRGWTSSLEDFLLTSVK